MLLFLKDYLLKWIFLHFSFFKESLHCSLSLPFKGGDIYGEVQALI